MICTHCKSELMEGDNHSRCGVHRKCTKSKPCKYDKDWTEEQWESLEASREAHKLARSNPTRATSGKNTGSVGSSEKSLDRSLRRQAEKSVPQDRQGGSRNVDIGHAVEFTASEETSPVSSRVEVTGGRISQELRESTQGTGYSSPNQVAENMSGSSQAMTNEQVMYECAKRLEGMSGPQRGPRSGSGGTPQPTISGNYHLDSPIFGHTQGDRTRSSDFRRDYYVPTPQHHASFDQFQQANVAAASTGAGYGYPTDNPTRMAPWMYGFGQSMIQQTMQAMFGQCPPILSRREPEREPPRRVDSDSRPPVTTQPRSVLSSANEPDHEQEEVEEVAGNIDYSVLMNPPSGVESPDEEEDGEATRTYKVFAKPVVIPILRAVAETSVFGIDQDTSDVDECALLVGNMRLPQSKDQAWLKVPREVALFREAAIKESSKVEDKAGNKKLGYASKLCSSARQIKEIFKVSDEDDEEFFAECVLDKDVKGFLKDDRRKGFRPDWEQALLGFDTQVKSLQRLAVFQLMILQAIVVDLAPSDEASEEDLAEAQTVDGNLACCKLLADMAGHSVKGMSVLLAQLSKLRRRNVGDGLEVAGFSAEFVKELYKVPSPANKLFADRLQETTKKAAKKAVALKEVTAAVKASRGRSSNRGRGYSNRGQRSRGRGALAARGRAAPPKRKAEAAASAQPAKRFRGRGSGTRGRGRGQQKRL